MLYLIYQFYIFLFAVENVFQWIDKINENIEGIAYNVERITVGTDDVLSPLEPTLMIFTKNGDFSVHILVQRQFSGHQYVAVQLMRTAGSPKTNVVFPNQTKPQPVHHLQL